MNAKTLADFRVDHGPILEALPIDSFTALVRAGVAVLDRIAQDGVRVRASAGAASFRRHSTLEECRRAAEQRVRDLQAEATADPTAATRRPGQSGEGTFSDIVARTSVTNGRRGRAERQRSEPGPRTRAPGA